MAIASDSNEDAGNLSVEITDLKHVIKVKDEEIQKLTEEVLKLKLIIADKFIDTQSTYDLPRPTEKPTRNGSYAKVVKKPAPTKCFHQILLNPNQMETSTPLTTGDIAIIKRSIEKSFNPQEIDFSIIKMKPSLNGGVMVTLPTKEDQEKAANKLNKRTQSLGIAVEIKRKLPRLIIQNIPKDGIENEKDLINQIKDNNPELTSLLTESESLRIVTIHNTKFESVIKVILEVIPQIRKYIM